MISKLTGNLLEFWTCNKGASSIEYAVLAAGVAVAIIATVQELGDPVDGLVGKVKTAWDANFGS